jgi:uncharacterized membrane protein YeaQ/YmgE (transglycosylase-associated protein family)
MRDNEHSCTVRLKVRNLEPVSAFTAEEGPTPNHDSFWLLRLSQADNSRRTVMEEAQIGWLAAIIIGGLAGWLAEMFMKSDTGLIMNIVLGVVGAVIANFIFNLVGISFGGWIGYLIAGFIGAVILIGIGRAITPRRALR